MGRKETYALALLGKEFWGGVLPIGIASTCGTIIWLIALALDLRRSIHTEPEAAQSAGSRLTGDTYTNSGANFGQFHMGPIHNHGKQPFTMTPDLISEAVARCPKGLPVMVMAVGPQSAIPMRDAIAAALRSAGYTVSLGWAGMMVAGLSGEDKFVTR
ncbi:MAG: hypothetical protein EOO77_23525 [Oxalobacteraceae bacterium]|nr:MAG: hypothetical protein EOO77_23525 [Oxalobacteraceae bacterium]